MPFLRISRPVPVQLRGETPAANEERHRRSVTLDLGQHNQALMQLQAQTATLVAITRALAIEAYGTWEDVPEELQVLISSFDARTLSHRGA